MGDYSFRLVLAFMAVLFFVMIVISFYAFQQGRIIELFVIFAVFMVVIWMFLRSFVQTA